MRDKPRDELSRLLSAFERLVFYWTEQYFCRHTAAVMNMNTSSRQLSMTSLAHIGNITRTMLVTLILIKYDKSDILALRKQMSSDILNYCQSTTIFPVFSAYLHTTQFSLGSNKVRIAWRKAPRKVVQQKLLPRSVGLPCNHGGTLGQSDDIIMVM